MAAPSFIALTTIRHLELLSLSANMPGGSGNLFPISGNRIVTLTINPPLPDPPQPLGNPDGRAAPGGEDAGNDADRGLQGTGLQGTLLRQQTYSQEKS